MTSIRNKFGEWNKSGRMSGYAGLLLTLSLLSACSGGSSKTEESDSNDNSNDNQAAVYTLLKSDQSRDTESAISSQQFSTFNSDTTKFAWDLYHEVVNPGENSFFSPFSISTALAMTYAGAQGETKAEMAEALNFTLTDNTLHAGFNLLTSTLDGRQLEKTDNLEALTLNVNNAVWADQRHPPSDDYLDTLALNYGTGLYTVDFKGAPKQARKIINAAVYDWTEELIADLLPEGIISADTAMVLTNTIYLYAPWQTPFKEYGTSTADFNNYDGSEVKVETMRGELRVRYAQENGVQLIAIPYRDSKLEMLIMLPDSGNYDTFEAGLTSASVDSLLNNLAPSFIQLYLPKFSLEQSLSLNDHLKALGMNQAFGFEADFSPMGLGQVYISDVVHKAFLEVHEAGTQAAAATAVVISETSMPVLDAFVQVDRPFVFLIRDEPTGNVLFMGRVLSL